MTQNRYLEAQLLWGLIIALLALGQLSQARHECEALSQLATNLGGPLPLAAYPDIFQAQLAYEWNDLAAAKSKALIAIEKTASLQYLDILLLAYVVLVRVCLAQGDLPEAAQAVHAMEQESNLASIPLLRPWVESLRVQLWLAQGYLPRALEWAEQTASRQELLAYNHEIASLTLVRVYLAAQRYPQALQLLSALLTSAERVSRLESMIAILALQVNTLQASGATQEVLCVLDRLLALAEPEGYRRTLLDAGQPMRSALQAWLNASPSAASSELTSYAQTILADFANEQPVQYEALAPASKALPSVSSVSPATSQALPEPLTPREQQVLLLLAEGATNQEIADQLVVSFATAKKHVGNILSKLGAENRTQAIARARSLSLL